MFSVGYTELMCLSYLYRPAECDNGVPRRCDKLISEMFIFGGLQTMCVCLCGMCVHVCMSCVCMHVCLCGAVRWKLMREQ